MATDFILVLDPPVLDAFAECVEQKYGEDIKIVFGKKKGADIYIISFEDYIDSDEVFMKGANLENSYLAVGYFLMKDIPAERELEILQKFAIFHENKDGPFPFKFELNLKTGNKLQIEIYYCVRNTSEASQFNRLKEISYQEDYSRKFYNCNDDSFFFQICDEKGVLRQEYRIKSSQKESNGKFMAKDTIKSSFELGKERDEAYFEKIRNSQGNEFFLDQSIHYYEESKDYIAILQNHCDNNGFEFIFNFVVDFKKRNIRSFIYFKQLKRWTSKMGNSWLESKQQSAQVILSDLRLKAFWRENTELKKFWTWQGPKSMTLLKSSLVKNKYPIFIDVHIRT